MDVYFFVNAMWWSTICTIFNSFRIKDINRVRICTKDFSSSLKHSRVYFSLP